ncbi:dixin isoform X4 [Strongylocentrotus purpuratus]|uniref:Dixin n=1 Tax=Strongylocentrotus purpuratus TaxID=7668 RepID=A0A7M7SVH9_STRPU|nr:dixin isoform X4 [Strongylocentrotus purpuratus]
MACEFHVSGSESSCSLRLDLEPRPTNNRTSQLLALLRDLVLKRWEVLYAWQVYQEQQLQAYVAWVNSQLKKRAGCRMVEDLRRDMQDGVALVHLVEIVSGEALSRVDYDATSATVMRENVERVLQFMASKRIRMHHTSAKDIVDGNLKSIMRLILALAAHYKPSSVKQASQASPMGASPSTPGTPNSTPQRKSQRQPSFTAMAANAAAAIHDARKEAAGAGSGSLRRYKDMTPTHKQGGESNDVPDGPLATGASSPLHPSAMVASPNTTSASASPMVNRMGSDRRRAMSPRQQMSLTHMSDSDQGSAGEDGGPHSLPSSRRSSISLSEALIEEQALMGDSIEDTKKLLQSLQELLLHGKIAEEDGSSEAEEDQIEFEGTTAKEQVVVLQARLNQQQYECNQLRNELSKVKQDCRNLQGTKAGLQSRLTEQDNAILQMKADSLKMGFTQQNLEAENSELKRNFEEKDRQASDISRQLGQKDKLLGQQQEQIESLTHQMLQLNSFKTQLQNRLEESGGSNMELESQIQELSHRLSTVGIAEANLAAHISAHDRKLGKLEGHLHNPDRPSSLGEGSEDMQTIRSTLRSLRSNISSHDPSHHLLDSLEQGIVSIMDQLQDSHYHNSRPISESSSTESAIRRYNQTRSSPSDDTLGDHKESLTSLDRLSPANNNLSQPCTKVLYFTERTVTPFMSSIPKRLGEVTLADFKQIFDREGAYRFHFKALDPEFGTVKEEVINDDDILPGWEGKIVGWVDEDTG